MAPICDHLQSVHWIDSTIQSSEELTITHEQLGRVLRALASLRETVLPKNERTFHVMAEERTAATAGEAASGCGR